MGVVLQPRIDEEPVRRIQSADAFIGELKAYYGADYGKIVSLEVRPVMDYLVQRIGEETKFIKLKQAFLEGLKSGDITIDGAANQKNVALLAFSIFVGMNFAIEEYGHGKAFLDQKTKIDFVDASNKLGENGGAVFEKDRLVFKTKVLEELLNDRYTSIIGGFNFGLHETVHWLPRIIYGTGEILPEIATGIAGTWSALPLKADLQKAKGSLGAREAQHTYQILKKYLPTHEAELIAQGEYLAHALVPYIEKYYSEKGWKLDIWDFRRIPGGYSTLPGYENIGMLWNDLRGDPSFAKKFLDESGIKDPILREKIFKVLGKLKEWLLTKDMSGTKNETEFMKRWPHIFEQLESLLQKEFGPLESKFSDKYVEFRQSPKIKGVFSRTA